MRYFKEEIQARRDIEREELLKQQNETVLWQFFTVHREFKDCMAARRLIDTFFEGAQLSAQLLEDAILATSLYQMLPKQTPEDDREKLQEAITVLLTGGGSPTSVEHEVRKFPYKTTEELVAWRDRLVEVKRARQATSSELRQLIKTAPPSRWKPLPECYRSRSVLLDLINIDVPGFKKLLASVGSDQINAVLNRRDGRD